MSFMAPHLWLILILAPLIWILLHVLDKKRALRLVTHLGPRALGLAPDLGQGQRNARRRLFTVGIFFALLALLQPVWGETSRNVEQRGVDILVCLDVSRSMLARDMKPNRLQRAQRELRSLAEHSRGNRMGLVLFAGEARLISPLTQDLESFADLTDLANPLSVSQGGTDLGGALKCALKALEGQSGDHEIILLITDGEDLAGAGLEAAGLCKTKKIKVHCIGFGGPQGSKITITEDEKESFLCDKDGVEVKTYMDSNGLKALARLTGGDYLEAGSRPLPLLKLYEESILPMSRKGFDSEKHQQGEHRFQWPLLIAFVLLILELCLTDRKLR